VIPKSVKILDKTCQVRLMKVKGDWAVISNKNDNLEIQIDPKLSDQDQLAALFSAVSDIITKRSKEVSPAISWRVFIQDNVFAVDWFNQLIKVKAKDKRPVPDRTILEDCGDDIKIIRRTGV